MNPDHGRPAPRGGGIDVIRAHTPECCPDCHQNLATFRKYGEFLLTENPTRFLTSMVAKKIIFENLFHSSKIGFAAFGQNVGE